MSVDFEKAQAIFLDAVELNDSSKQDSFLDQACGDDQEMRQHLGILLSAHGQSGSFLEKGAFATRPTIEQPIAEKPGTEIGPYKLLQQIGEGGMGVVYMAEQTEPVSRRVALKIIKPGMDTRQVIARFEAERQALAMMDHPNIAKVFDAGTTETGRPYFVMELVKGVPITEYCDEHQLSPRERLELFLPACQAIQHAHQKGIIHRDIKPSNVMVAQYDDRPVPKVIDFGAAKAIEQRLTEKTVFTEYGQVVGTMEYMSPEQAKLNQQDVDTRSDIYSLGVLLYELLTGETPFDGKRLRSAAFDELLRIIREEDPPRPSQKLSTSQSLPTIAANRQIEPKQLSTLVHGELDWIVMKALEKDRTRRYDTASKFAEDLQHYLNDEAVEACPPSTAYRLRKFVRRNKTAMATTAAIALAIVAGIIGTTWQAVRATQERNRAMLERNRALAAEVQASDEAERADSEAEKAKAEAAISESINDFLQKDLLGMVSPGSQIEDGMVPDPTIELITLLGRAGDKIEERFGDQPVIEAALRYTIGSTYRQLGEYELSETNMRRSYELFHNVRGLDHPDTLASLHGLANALHDQGKYRQAEALLKRALNIYEKTLGKEHVDTLNAMNSLGTVLLRLGQYDDSVELYRNTLRIRSSTLGEQHPDTLYTMYNLANVHLYQDRLEESLRLFRDVEGLLSRVRGAQHPSTMSAKNAIAVVQMRLGQHAEAESTYRWLLETQQQILGEEHPSTIMTKGNLALALSSLGQHAKAVNLYREALKLQCSVIGNEHPETVKNMGRLASALHFQGSHIEAETLYRETIELQSRILGVDHPETERTKINLARHYTKRCWQLATHANVDERDSAECLRMAQLAIKLEPEVSNHWDKLGIAYYRNSKWVEAIEALEKSREMQNGNDRYHQLFLAMSYWQAGRRDEAVANYVQASKWLANGQQAAEQYRFRDEADTLFLDSSEGLEMVLKAVSDEVERRPEDRALLVVRAQLYAATKAWEQSAADWARVIDSTDVSRSWPSPRQSVCRDLAASPELFNLVAELRPDEPDVWIGRGQYYALLSQWIEAANDYARATPLQPIADQTYQYAGLLLLVGDENGYQKFCGELTALAGKTNDTFAAYVIARSFALGPVSDMEPNEILEWAEKGVTENKNAWELHVLGLAQYRAGQFDEVIQSLEASNAGKWSALAKVQNDLVLAMAYHRQGDQEKAEQVLQKAKNIIDQSRSQHADQPVDVAVPDWIGIEVLRREAERLVELPNEEEEPEHSESDKSKER